MPLLEIVSSLAVGGVSLAVLVACLNEAREVLWGGHVVRYLATALWGLWMEPKLASPAAHTVWRTHAVLSSIDLNRHVNNAVYNSWLDFARAAFLARLYSSRDAYNAHPVHNGGVQIYFLREIKLWTRVAIFTNIHAAGPKWMYLRSVFRSDAGVVHAVALTRVVAKHGRGSSAGLRGKTVPPGELVKLLGYSGGLPGGGADAASLGALEDLLRGVE